MSTKRASGWRSRLALPVLFVASFALTALAIWPEAKVTTAANQSATLASEAVGDASPESDSRPAAATTLEDADPPATPAPTLQELAVNSDPATRSEAQALLDVLNEEAAADYP
jgi:hypothetical protein